MPEIEKSFEERARAVMAQLQAPVADKLICWKPGTVQEFDGKPSCIFFPYIDASILAERLDTVLGLWGWNVHYKDLEGGKVSECVLEVTLPDESRVVRYGVGAFDNADEGHAEHGSRTKAFRDACRALGVCGRDLDGYQTKWIKCQGNKYNDKWKNIKPLSPLSRNDLKHPGREHSDGSDAPVTVRTSPESDRATRSPERAEYKTSTDAVSLDPMTWVWDKGKHAGQLLIDTPTAYLQWCLENRDDCKVDGPKFKKAFYDAICIAIDHRAKQKQQPAPAKEVLQGRLVENSELSELDAIFSSEDEIPF